MHVSENIKACRKKAGLSQKELGKKLGVSQQHIAQYESGKRLPKIETLMRLSRALGVDIDDLADTSELAIIDIREHPEKWGLDKDNLSKDRVEHAFKKLNTIGKEKAAERVEELTEIPRYTNPDNPSGE